MLRMYWLCLMLESMLEMRNNFYKGLNIKIKIDDGGDVINIEKRYN